MPFTDTTAGTLLVPGPAGASAYEAWLALGNTGSLTDYVAAQKGDPGQKGDKGDPSTVPGPPGTGTIVTATRSATVAPSTYVVRLSDGTCVTADPTNTAHQGLVLGLDVLGGAAGSTAQVNSLGLIQNVTGSFSAGDAIWIGDGTTARLGAPVNVPPAASATKDIWRQQVGTAATSSTINGLLGLAYLIRASGTPALVGPGSYVTTTSLGQAVVQSQDAATGRGVLGAAASGANSDISGLSAVTGNLFVRSAPGAVPTQNLDFGVSDYANIRHCLYQGSPSSPYSQDAYIRPAAYIERHASGRLNRRQATDSNWLLAPTVHVQTYAEAGSSNALTSIHARMSSLTAAGTAPTADTSDGITTQAGINLSVNALCAYTGTVVLGAPNGSANRSGWAANFESYWNSGNNPVNLVGIEVDIINTAGAPSGALPGVNDNFTAFWAQTASRNAYPATCAFLVTDVGLTNGVWTSGWEYGAVLNSQFYQWALWINNNRNVQDVNGASQGAYINIAFQSATANVMLCAAGTNSQFQVTGDSTNPISMRINGVVRNVRVKPGNALGASDIVLVHV